MPEDTSNPFSAVIGALANKGGPKGVVKDSDGKVSPHLTPSETARYEKIFSIMKKVVNPGPETGKLDKTAEGKAGSTASMEKVAKQQKDGGFKMPGLGNLATLGLAAAAIGAALTTMSDELLEKINGYTEEIVKFGDDAGDEFGKLGGLALKLGGRLAGKLGAKVGLKALKVIPFIGSFVNFYYAKQHFDNEEWFDGTYEMVSGLAGLFPGAGSIVSAVMDGYKIYAEVEANRREKAGEKKPAFKSILKEHAAKLGTFIYESIRDGNVPILSGLFKFGEGIGLIATGQFKEGFGKWAEILPAMLGPWGKPGSPLRDAIDTFTDIGGEKINDAVQSGKRMAGDAWGFMKKAFEDIGNIFASFFEGIQKWVSETLEAGKKFITEKLGIDTGDMVEEDGSINKTEVAKGVGKAAFNVSPLGMGINAGKAAVDFFMNDGTITKDGKVTSFNDQDDVLAAKSGGPIDKMLDGNSTVMKSLASINAQQLNVLVEIRDGISALKSSGGVSFNNNSLTEEFYA